MRCSECSEVVRPVVAVDIDGTLGDYHGHFLAFAKAWLQQDYMPPIGQPDYTGQVDFSEWFMEVCGVDRRTWSDIKLAYRQGGMKRSMPVYPFAREMVAMVREADAELWLTTTRPYMRLDGVDPDTRFWLGRHGIAYDGLLYDEDKYSVLGDRVDKERVVTVLDDLPEQIAAAERAFGWRVPLWRRTVFNEALTPHDGAWALDAATGIILDRIEEWRHKHGS